MPQLPFVVAPRRETRIVSADVNGETCSLEFPVYGCLLAGEAVMIAEHEYQAAVYRESSRLADALVGEGTDETDAQRIAIRVLSTRLGIPVALDVAEQRITLRHSTLIADVQNQLAAAFEQQVLRSVTAAIVHRLPGCRDWSDADTAGLPLELQKAIAAFLDQERNANKPERTPDEMVEEMTETLGKLQSPPTGESSTGDAAGSGPLPLSSAPSDSPGSPSPTSSRRSRRASAG